jgi:hypothetical protein
MGIDGCTESAHRKISDSVSLVTGRVLLQGQLKPRWSGLFSDLSWGADVPHREIWPRIRLTARRRRRRTVEDFKWILWMIVRMPIMKG